MRSLAECTGLVLAALVLTVVCGYLFKWLCLALLPVFF